MSNIENDDENKNESTKNIEDALENALDIEDSTAPVGEILSIDFLKSELEKTRAEALYQRAELENLRKRLFKEQDMAIKFANERVFREILSVVDLLERALAFAPKNSEQKEVSTFVSGIEMTHKEFIQLLSKFSVELVGTVDEPFNPNIHEAISSIEVEASRIDKVIQVFQRGCRFEGRLLKPAMVVVGKGS